MPKLYDQCPKSIRKGEGSKRECICVSRNSAHRCKTSVIPYYAHMPLVNDLEEWLYLRCSECGVEDKSGAYPIQLSQCQLLVLLGW